MMRKSKNVSSRAKESQRTLGLCSRGTCVWIPSVAQISPSWILFLYQSDLLASRPVFELFLARDGQRYRNIGFEPYQAVTTIFRSETGICAGFMFPNSSLQIVRNADIQHMSPACDNVSVIVMFSHQAPTRSDGFSIICWSSRAR